MKNKTIIILLFSIIFSINSLAQQADKFILVDTLQSRGYEVEKGATVKVKTDSIGYFGALNNVTDDGIVINNTYISWDEIVSIKFEDRGLFDM